MPIGDKGPNNRPAMVRFWQKVRIMPNGCWQWQGAVSGDGGKGEAYGGYGQLRNKYRIFFAHRYAYEALHARIEDGMYLDHLCRNHGCVNPLHLEPVTQRENVLRGVGACSVNAKKTHCPKGHPLDGDNVLVEKTPCGKGRKCRTCHNDRQRLAYQKKKTKGALSGLNL